MKTYVESKSREWPRVAVVTVSRNRCGVLSQLLSQIEELDYPSDKIDIFVVDNASTDNTSGTVRKLFPQVNLQVASRNLGISAGFNCGVRHALANGKTDYEYIWLLDDDVVLDKMSLRTLVEAFESDADIAVVGSAVYDISDPEQLVTAGFKTDWQKATINYHVPEGKNGQTLFDVDSIAACSLLSKAACYKEYGLWDEHFWLYWGDTEWCTRLSAMGYRICCETKSRAWHRNWALVAPHFFSPVLLYDQVRGALLFNLRHNPKTSIDGLRHLIVKSHLKAIMEIFTQRPFFSQGLIKGVGDFLGGNFPNDNTFSWADRLETTDLFEIHGAEVHKKIVHKAGQNLTVILNQIKKDDRQTKIKRFFEKHFNQIDWTEIPIKRNIKKSHLSDHFSEYLFFHIPRLLFRLPLFFKRKDLIISDIAHPDMYNIVAARYTMFIDSSGNISVVENRLCRAAVDIFQVVLRCMRALFVQLPGIRADSQAFKPSTDSAYMGRS